MPFRSWYCCFYKWRKMFSFGEQNTFFIEVIYIQYMNIIVVIHRWRFALQNGLLMETTFAISIHLLRSMCIINSILNAMFGQFHFKLRLLQILIIKMIAPISHVLNWLLSESGKVCITSNTYFMHAIKLRVASKHLVRSHLLKALPVHGHVSIVCLFVYL